ncbi:MAG: PAS domain-containing protein [Candidatus Eremiobacterota bacterium]
MSNLPGMAYRCKNDQCWTMEFVSEGCFHLTGYEPSDLIDNKRLSYNDIVHHDDRNNIWQQIQLSVAEKKPFELVYRIITAKNEEKWVWEKGQGVFSDTGDLVALEGFITDITESKKGEGRLRESEYSYRTLAQNLPGIVYRVFLREGHKMKFFNDMLLPVTGFKQEEITEGDVCSIYHLIDEEDRQNVIKTVEKAVLDNSPFQLEYRFNCKDGHHRYFFERGRPVCGKDGLPLYIDGVIFDVTEQKMSEHALKESESRNRALLAAIPDIMFIYDRNGIFLDYHASDMCTLLVPPEQFIGKNLKDILPSKISETVMQLLNKALETGKGQAMEYSLFIEGKEKYFESRIVPCDSEKVLSVVRDITEKKKAEEERKKLEQQLQHAQKLESLGVLAGGIAHDFNNILTGILGYADLTLLDLSPLSPARDSVQQIVIAARRAADLTKQMLAYSGKGKFLIQPLQISNIVQEMSHLLEVSISKKCLLKYNFAKELPFIEGDATQLRQVIMNLIINASDAIGEYSGVISLNTGIMYCDHAYLSESYINENLPEGYYVYLEVADTGCGMTRDIQNKIFDPFFTTKFTGRGLGLAAVLGIVRSHHGCIKIYSEPGRGTNFRVIFPASNVDGKEIEKEKSEAKGWRGKGTILVVDDEKTVRTVAKAMLTKLGFTVLAADDGITGLEAFKNNINDIGAVLLDMTMPRMNGEETFHELRRLRQDVQVILSSGYNEQEAISRFPGQGLAGFIQKPYRVDELVKVLRKVFKS